MHEFDFFTPQICRQFVCAWSARRDRWRAVARQSCGRCCTRSASDHAGM